MAGPGAPARLHARSGGDPDERVAGADDGRGRARQRRPVPRALREVGCRRHGRRRGHRLRTAHHRLARRGDRRRAAAQRGARRPDVPPPLLPPRRPGRAAGRPGRGPAPPWDRGRAAHDAAAAGGEPEPL